VLLAVTTLDAAYIPAVVTAALVEAAEEYAV